jgi:NAD(P)-dependent dehydrogenase (short-subunit alcohol dehydrogenase family)
MDFNNLMFPEGNGYSPTVAYGRSKLANLLFTYELQRRLKSADADVIAVAAHPGIANTNLANHLVNEKLLKLASPLINVIMQSAAIGALPTIRAAVDPNVSGGQYYGPGGFKERRGYPVLVDSNKASHNLSDAQQLWQVSEHLTGVQYL